jgi:hypothetical protein
MTSRRKASQEGSPEPAYPQPAWRCAWLTARYAWSCWSTVYAGRCRHRLNTRVTHAACLAVCAWTILTLQKTLTCHCQQEVVCVTGALHTRPPGLGSCQIEASRHAVCAVKLQRLQAHKHRHTTAWEKKECGHRQTCSAAAMPVGSCWGHR